MLMGYGDHYLGQMIEIFLYAHLIDCSPAFRPSMSQFGYGFISEGLVKPFVVIGDALQVENNHVRNNIY